MPTLNWPRLFTLFLSTLLLYGCGFHYRAPFALRGSKIHVISSTPYSETSKALIDRLSEYGILSTEQAPIVLTILNENLQRQVSADTSSVTSVNEYNLKLTVSYSLKTHSGKILVSNNTVSSQRVITSNSNQILGTENSISVIRQEMVRDVVNQIFDQLNSTRVKANLAAL